MGKQGAGGALKPKNPPRWTEWVVYWWSRQMTGEGDGRRVHYIAASWTFCCNSITFSRKRLSVSIRSLTVWQERITVVWSRPPKCSPIVFREFLVKALARYIVICLA